MNENQIELFVENMNKIAWELRNIKMSDIPESQKVSFSTSVISLMKGIEIFANNNNNNS